MSKIPKLRYDTERINKEIPIADVIERYMGVKIKSIRKHFLCPIHSERTPSARIYVKSNTFHCFGCGATLTPLDVAVWAMPNKKFPSVCQTLLEDTGYDPYRYSNLSEVETAKEQNSWGKKKDVEYRDYFPFALQELQNIGLYNYPINRDDCSRIAVVIPLSQIHEAIDVYNTYKLTGVAKSFSVKKDASLVVLTMDADAAEVLKLKPYEFFSDEKEDIIQFWHKDKAVAEKLIDNFCQATVSSQRILLSETENLLNTATAEYAASNAEQSIKQYTERLCEANSMQEFNAIVKNITPQEREFWDMHTYISDLKDKIATIKGNIEYAQNIQQRLTAHQAEREERMPKRSWKDFCTNR